MREGTKIWGKIVGIVFLLAIAGIITKVVFFPVHVADKAVDTANGVVDKTLNADNVLQNYENFKDLYHDAKSQVMNIETAKKSMEQIKETYGDPSTWTKDVRENYNFQQQNINGYMMQYQSLVKEYNSDSSKMNKNLFKDKNLPSELPLDYTQLP